MQYVLLSVVVFDLMLVVLVGQHPLLVFIGIYVFVRFMDCAIPVPACSRNSQNFILFTIVNRTLGGENETSNQGKDGGRREEANI